MRTRIVHTKIWNDDWFYALSSDAQRLFLYCLTNQYIGLTGVYELSDRIICFDLKLSTENLEQLKNELTKKVIFIDGWVIVLKANSYNSYTGEKNQKAITRELLSLPQHIRRYCIDTLSTTPNTLINHKSKIINHKSEITDTSDTVSKVDTSPFRVQLRAKGLNV